MFRYIINATCIDRSSVHVSQCKAGEGMPCYYLCLTPPLRAKLVLKESCV